MKTLYIKTFGCQMNDYDATRMTALLHASHGYCPVETPEQADLIILNTCHIREKAEEKLFSELGRLRKQMGARAASHRSAHTEERRAKIFAVGGCVAQATGQEIFRRAPFVQLVFGPQTYHRLPAMLERLARQGGPVCDTDLDGAWHDSAHLPLAEAKFDALPPLRKTGALASVTIQEGCHRFCAFCVVPFTRGPAWSRPPEAIEDEVAHLVQRGAVEIQFLGQNVNAYDGVGADGVTYDLALLLRRAALIPGVKRLRFVTSHPADMTQDLVDVFADVPQLCPYVHLPIQSGSDRILARMGRGHTAAEYRGWVERLRQVSPDVAMASDFIVGFPGERDVDFQDTLTFVESIGFDHAYSFCFSARPGTQADDRMRDDIPLEVKSRRNTALLELQNEISLQDNQHFVGRTMEILVEGLSKKPHLDRKDLPAGLPSENPPCPLGHASSRQLVGRTKGDHIVVFQGGTHLTGQIVPVKIAKASALTLFGELAG